VPEQVFAVNTYCGWMARLMPLRDELLRGDLRALYLGWLAGVSRCEVDGESLEHRHRRVCRDCAALSNRW
jgi:hypothetical protein